MEENVIKQKEDNKKDAGCSSCDSKSCDKKDCKNCAHKKKIVKLPANPMNHIKHVVGIVSGKGGVGKSSVTSMVAVELQRRGYKFHTRCVYNTGRIRSSGTGNESVC